MNQFATDVDSVVIRAADLEAGYGDRVALEGITLEVGPGELVAVVGPNGSGKSTFLKVLAGLLHPSAGKIAVFDAAPGRRPQRVAFLSQAESVEWSFPVSVWDVVLMGRYSRIGWFRRPGEMDAAAVHRALEQVGMRDLAQRQVGELSGGQQRRAFLARALAQEPDLYLLDEPVTGVDMATEEDLMAVLIDECKRGKTVLASTHDLASVAVHFSRSIWLNRRLVADGPASLVRDAAVLRATYGGHLIEVSNGVLLVDDPHDRRGKEMAHHD